MSDEPMRQGVEALATFLEGHVGCCVHKGAHGSLACALLASDWFAERIAETRREIADEVSRVAQIEWENGNVTVGAFERLEAALRGADA